MHENFADTFCMLIPQQTSENKTNSTLHAFIPALFFQLLWIVGVLGRVDFSNLLCPGCTSACWDMQEESHDVHVKNLMVGHVQPHSFAQENNSESDRLKISDSF